MIIKPSAYLASILRGDQSSRNKILGSFFWQKDFAPRSIQWKYLFLNLIFYLSQCNCISITFMYSPNSLSELVWGICMESCHPFHLLYIKTCRLIPNHERFGSYITSKKPTCEVSHCTFCTCTIGCCKPDVEYSTVPGKSVHNGGVST